jgi:general stress protein YciG
MKGFALLPQQAQQFAAFDGLSYAERVIFADGELADVARKAVPQRKPGPFIDKDLAREAGRKGGAAVKPGNRSFSKNRELAREAGRKGGTAQKARDKSFFKDRDLAREAGKKAAARRWEKRVHGEM